MAEDGEDWRETIVKGKHLVQQNDTDAIFKSQNPDGGFFFCQQVFSIIRSTENPQMFSVEFIRGATKKFMSTER